MLLPRLIFKLYSYGTGQLEDNYFDPSNHKDSKLAVVITGCDSGFGRELALYAAEAGFVVFAGCLKRDSFDQVTVASRGTIHALELDVTQNEHVAKMAEEVKKWLKDDTGGKEKRVLHALVNNAGIGYSGNIDWAEISDFQKIFDGKLLLQYCDRLAISLFSAKRRTYTYVMRRSQLFWYGSMLQSPFANHERARYQSDPQWDSHLKRHKCGRYCARGEHGCSVQFVEARNSMFY